jgi:hypothetical protein
MRRISRAQEDANIRGRYASEQQAQSENKKSRGGVGNGKRASAVSFLACAARA